MPNDPRVKFKKKKIYDSSRNFIYFGGEGSGGMRSIFEDGTPPPDRPDLPGPINPIDPTPRIVPPIPQPIRPSLNPGEITGITVGSLIGAAATVELTRRAVEQARRRRGGEQRVPQDDRPFSSRQSGGQRIESRGRVGRAISRGINNAIQSSFEMATPSSTYRPIPIQSEMVLPSGATTPREVAPASDRLSSLFPDTTGAPGPAPQSTPTPTPIRKPDVALDLQKELNVRQIELQNPNISEARTKTLNSEIRVLERQIETNAKIRAQRTRAAPAPPPPEPPSEPIASRTRSKAGKQLNEELKLIRQEQDLARIETLTDRQPSLSEKIQLANTDLAKVNVPRQEVYLRGRLTANLNKLEKSVAEIELKLLNVNISNERRQALIAQQERYRKQIAAIDEGQSSRISKTITTEINTSVHNPANDNLRATQPTREFELRLRPVIETEMQRVRRTDFAEIGEIVQAAMQQMGSRKPIERAKVGQTPNFEGELIGPQFSERQAAGVGFDLSAPRPLVENRPEPQRPTTIDPFEAEPEPPPRSAPVERPAEIGTELKNLREPSVGGRLALERARAAKAAKTEELALDAEMARLQKRLNEVRNATGPIENIPEGTVIEALRERPTRPPPEDFGREMENLRERPAPRVERPARPIEQEMGEEIGGLRAQNDIAEFNNLFDTMMTTAEQVGFELPKAPANIEAQGELAVKKYQYEEALEFIEGKDIFISETAVVKGERITTGKARSKKKQLRLVEELYQRAVIQEGGRPSMRPAERATAPAEARAPTAQERLAQRSQEIRSGQQEINRLVETQRAAPAPEAMSARRQLASAPEPAGPRVRAQVESINTTRRPSAPAGEPPPSAPPSAPGTETATPREGAIVEQTPAERAAFAEEVRLGMSKKPGRQKVKINVGKTNNTTRNPLDIFVNPQFRNTPNLEINPSAKNLRGALTELSARVPKLVPSKKVLISVGSEIAAEGGGMIAGFYAGSEAGKAMSNYFATHPPKNRGEEYGQALATNMVALGVGNLVAKAVTYAIRQGVRIAIGAEITGSISGAGTAGFSALAEAALFATVATTTQFYVTKTLEDAGNSHAYSRAMGAVAATEALVYTDIAMWLAKGGPYNPAGDLSFIASELFIIGFGIYSVFEEYTEGRRQDIEGEEYEAEVRAEREKAEQDRRDAIDGLNKNNNAKALFLTRLPKFNYDFDALYERLTEEEKTDLGILTPESRATFQREVERTFDPFSSFETSENGLIEPRVLTELEKGRNEVMNSYINWYIDELRGVSHPPFNFDDPKVRDLNEYSGGTWQSAAKVSASTNYLQAEQVYPLISNAQNEIIDAFHNERKTIEQMDPLTVRYATLDSTFRENYEAYIVTDAAAQILIEFNRTQYTYNDVDPALLAIADRDPNFRAAADMYYQVLANQARDYNLSISEVARLNSLMETDQVIEIGKLNEARNAIVNKNQAENQAMVDSYNANILREINIYGDNFEAIIRNINDQSLLSGHTFLYATNRADLYRQLHLEVPEVEIVDPVDVDRPDATFGAAKGRKVGDTAIYGYRYNLTDEQNQEIEDLISANKISRFDAEKQALVIYNRDRAKFVQTDQEKANSLGLTLDGYYEKFGITEPTIIITELTYQQLQTLYPTQYRDLQQKYKNDPDADKKIEETLARAHKRRMDETGGVFTPTGQAEDLTVEQLQKMYPTKYIEFTNLFTNNGKTPLTEETIKAIEVMLRQEHITATNAGTAPPIPVEPQRDPTYEELQVMYPEQFDIYNDSNSAIGQEDKTEMMLRRLHARRTQAGTAPNIPGTGEETPVDNQLKNGVLNMPDGSTRIYKNGLVVNVMYQANVDLSKAKNAQEINAAEGQQNADYVPTTGLPTTLRQGTITMPDGSKRIYVDGKVVSVNYPEGQTGPTINQINSYEGKNTVPIDQSTNPGGLMPQIETPIGETLPFVPGAKSFEYADSGTQARPAPVTAPAPTPTSTN